MIVAPVSANTLSKLSYGIADNFLLTISRAWDMKNKPLIICPAMNTMMWLHPSTEASLTILRAWGCTIVEPVTKVLACGDQGPGALAAVDDIIHHIILALSKVRRFSLYSSTEHHNQSIYHLSLLNPLWRTSPALRYKYHFTRFLKKLYFYRRLILTNFAILTGCIFILGTVMVMSPVRVVNINNTIYPRTQRL